MNPKETKNIAAEELLKRIVEFLKESNALVKIRNIDYSLPELQRKDNGYFGAFLESQNLALNHLPISLSDLCRWQSMIVKEQLQFGHSITKQAVGKIRSKDLPINIKIEDYQPTDFSKVPMLIEENIKEINKRLKDMGNNHDEVSLVALLGDIYQKFEEIHPFVEANGRLGLLIVNYIVSWFGFPIIVFRNSEKAEFYAAHHNATSMRIFMAKKIQEAVFDDEGKIYNFSENYGLTSSYSDPNNLEAEKILVEWHSLVKAINQWKNDLQKESQ